VNSNGFGQGGTFASGPSDSSTDFDDVLTTLGFFSGTTHIQVCNDHDDVGAHCDNNTSHVEAWWQAPPGFLGGNVTFCATQTTTKCFTLVVVGPIGGCGCTGGGLTLGAYRHESEIGSTCQDTPVYVIASVEYSENNITSFDNDRAVLCAVARDSNGSMVAGATLIWTTTKGCLDSSTTTTTGDVRDYDNRLRACSTAHSGDIATVTVTNGSSTASTTVQFGGDPASCTVVVPETSLAVGDHSHVVATFLDSKGNWVPDGIVAHLEEVDSGDGADNVQFVSKTEDTVKGVVEGDIINAIAGLTTIAASVEQVAGADPVCSDEIVLSGNIHTEPIVCKDASGALLPSGILAGFTPPLTGGFGTFQFCGGTFAQLFAASKCPGPQSSSSSAFFYNKPSGTFAVWIPGSTVAAANAEILAIWPEQIPRGTIFTAKCLG
jgi:hypothetical protein